MRRHFEFVDGTKHSAQYRKGDQARLDELTDAKAQIEYAPETADPATWRKANRPEFTNPLIKTWDTEK